MYGYYDAKTIIVVQFDFYGSFYSALYLSGRLLRVVAMAGNKTGQLANEMSPFCRVHIANDFTVGLVPASLHKKSKFPRSELVSFHFQNHFWLFFHKLLIVTTRDAKLPPYDSHHSASLNYLYLLTTLFDYLLLLPLSRDTSLLSELSRRTTRTRL